MPNDNGHNVVSIFQQRHRHGEIDMWDSGEDSEFTISPDGFNYVSTLQEQGGMVDADNLLEVAAAKHYLVKMMEVHNDSHQVRLNQYEVPGNRLEDFLLSLKSRPGQILEIKQYIPDHLA